MSALPPTITKVTVWFREFEDGDYELGIFDGEWMDVGDFHYCKWLAEWAGREFFPGGVYIGEYL